MGIRGTWHRHEGRNGPKRRNGNTNSGSRYGKGFAPVSASDWNPRIEAVSLVLKALRGDVRTNTEETVSAIRRVRDIFFKVAEARAPDWFTLSCLLGNPSERFCQTTCEELRKLEQAAGKGDRRLWNEVYEFMKTEYVMEMLESYLDVTLRAKHPVVEKEWAFVLSSATEPDVAIVGATSETVDAVVAELARSHPEQAPFGITAAWLVHDSEAAAADIRARLHDHWIGEDQYRIEGGVMNAKRIVDRILRQSDNTAMSPWHVEDDEPEAFRHEMRA